MFWRWPTTAVLPAVLVLAACPGVSREEASPQTIRGVIELCDQFLAAPEDVDPAPIEAFMRESPELVVVLGPHLDGVVRGEGVPDWAASLLRSGYIAGDVRAQLIAGKKLDSPIAGYRGVLTVYRALQPKGLSVSAIDDLAAAEQNRTLDVWVKVRVATAVPTSE